MEEKSLSEVFEEFRDSLKVPLYTVSDRVKLDSGAIATIFAVMPGRYYKNAYAPKADYTNWYATDEDWDKKNVYFVVLDETAKPVSFEQFCEFHPEIKEEHLFEEYEKSFPETWIMTVVENAILGGA